jgi:predicted membrane metal-binding protein
MRSRFVPAFLLKILAAALAGLLLALWVPSMWGEVRLRWLLAAGVALATALLAGAGVVLRSRGRNQDLDLSPSELTTLTFPPEGRMQRPQRR